MRELTIEANISHLHDVIGFVDEQLEACHCPMAAQIQLDLAVEEIFVNIALYAYGSGSGSATIQVETMTDPRGAIVTLIDSGSPFNPLAKPDPDVTLGAKDRQIGGLGIYMAKKSVDEMKYEYADGCNRLSMMKTF